MLVKRKMIKNANLLNLFSWHVYDKVCMSKTFLIFRIYMKMQDRCTINHFIMGRIVMLTNCKKITKCSIMIQCRVLLL